jgi:hypothetical protein
MIAYCRWVRQKGDTWLMCDDEDVSPVHEEDVLKLSGGGDWHTAYLLLYAPRWVPLPGGGDRIITAFFKGRGLAHSLPPPLRSQLGTDNPS